MRTVKDEKASHGIYLGMNPYGIYELDIIKQPNGIGLLNKNGLQLHEFKKAGITMVEGRRAYRIKFLPKDPKTIGYKGFMLIDVETLAFLYFDIIIKAKDGGYVDYRKFSILGIEVRTSDVLLRIRYSKIGDKYYLNYVQNDTHFNFKSFHENYDYSVATHFDYVVTQVTTADVEKFSRKEVLAPETFIEKGKPSYDLNFWNDYNIILPIKSFTEIAEKIEDKNSESDAED